MIHGIKRTRVTRAGRREGDTWLFPGGMLLIFHMSGVSVRQFRTDGVLAHPFAYIGRSPEGGWIASIPGVDRIEFLYRRSAIRWVVRHYRAAQFAGTL